MVRLPAVVAIGRRALLKTSCDSSRLASAGAAGCTVVVTAGTGSRASRALTDNVTAAHDQLRQPRPPAAVVRAVADADGEDPGRNAGVGIDETAGERAVVDSGKGTGVDAGEGTGGTAGDGATRG